MNEVIFTLLCLLGIAIIIGSTVGLIWSIITNPFGEEDESDTDWWNT